MKHHVRPLYVFVVVALLCSLEGTSLSGQFSGTGNDQRMQSYAPTPPLSQLPPYSSDMPVNCIAGYRRIDSLSQAITDKQALDAPLYARLDSLRTDASYLYAIADYNPLLWHRVIAQTKDSLPPPYTAYPASIYYGVLDAIIQRRSELGNDVAMMLGAEYILRVRIDSVVTGTDTLYPSNPVPWVNASCTVLETFKGWNRPANCSNSTSGTSCLNFGFPQNGLTGFGFSDSLHVRGTIRTPMKDREFIAFLNHVAIDRQGSYISPIREFDISGGLLEITNGRVADVSGLFSQDTSPTLEQFRELLLQRINTINGWNLPASVMPEKNCSPLLVHADVSITNRSLHLDYTLPNPGTVSISMYNSLGVSVMLASHNESSGPHRYEYSVKEFPAGAYVLCVRYAGTVHIIKLFLS